MQTKKIDCKSGGEIVVDEDEVVLEVDFGN
jgi:hypothetical protein